MLLTLTASSLQHYRRAKKPLAVEDIPEFVAEELGLRGLSLNAGLLKGKSIADLERLRDRADRAHCPVLVLVEEEEQDFVSVAGLRAAEERLGRLGLAASKLGCPNLAIRCAKFVEGAGDQAAASIKRTLAKLDRFDVHLLIRPGDGVTADPARMADLIKRIGGFRIGALPSFSAAAATGDAPAALRRLAPYAQAIEATVKAFTKAGKHDAWSLDACLDAVRDVGYQNTVAIDYVGRADPVESIKRARDVLAKAIEAEEASA